MLVDIIAVVLVLIFGYIGYRQGFLAQLIRIAGLVAAYFVARMATPGIAEFIARRAEISDILAKAIAFGAVFFLVWLIFSLVAMSLRQKLGEEGPAFSFFQRGLGGLLGALKGALLVYVIVSLLLVGRQTSESLSMDLSGSIVAKEVARHDLLQAEILPRVRALGRMMELLHDENAMARMREDPRYRAILTSEKAAFLSEPEIQRAFRERDWAALVTDGRVIELLMDAEVAEAVAELPPGDAPLSPEIPNPAPAPVPAPQGGTRP